MKRSFLFPLLFPLFLFASCGRVDCITQSDGLGVSFSGYDTDTGIRVIVSQFPKNGPVVPTQRDTFVIDSNILYREIGDSVSGKRLVSSYLTVHPGYDWQVDVPATGKRDYISGIEFTHDTRKKQFMEGGGWGNQCINVCTGYYLNGKYVATGYTGAVPYGSSTGVYITLLK